jgi:transposase
MSAGKFVLHHTKQIKGDITYIYHMIAWYYRKNNKPYRNIIKNLGKLTSGEIEYYKDAVACINRDPNILPCNVNKIEVEQSLSYLPCAVGIHFWNYWDLSKIFPAEKEKKKVSTHDIAMILTALRFVQNTSKSFSTVLYEETSLPTLTGIAAQLYNKTRLFRELENIESYREALGRHIFEYAKRQGYTKGEVVFYDLSSSNFSGLRCLMAKWGHCKDGYYVHVVSLIVITPEGYPIYWELLEGNTADAKTIERLISKVEKIYGHLESVICFDRGMVSDENLRLLESKEIEFITALDGNQVSYFDDVINFGLFEKIKELDYKSQGKKIKEILEKNYFSSQGHNLYYYELILPDEEILKIEKETDKLALRKRRYFLAFNPELAYLTAKHRKERVEEFENWVSNYNVELRKALKTRNKETIEKNIKKELRKRKISDVVIGYELEACLVKNKDNKGKTKNVRTFQIKLNPISEKSYEQAEKYDGLWILITSISNEREKEFFNKSNFMSYFEIYRLKTTIEESFKILSNFVGVEPFYVYKDEHVKAHFTLCVLAYLINVTILNEIRSSSKIKNKSLERIFHELKKCRQDKIKLTENRTISKITQLSSEQNKILDVLDCKYLISPDFLYQNEIISL